MKIFDKLPSFGSIFAAAACPVCFPALAGLGSALGLGVFAQYESQALILFQLLILISAYGAWRSFQRHKKIAPFIISLIAVIAVLFSYHFAWSYIVIYSGIALLIGSAVSNMILEKKYATCCDASISPKKP